MHPTLGCNSIGGGALSDFDRPSNFKHNIFGKWIHAFINCSSYQFAFQNSTWQEIILPSLLPQLHAFLFHWGNKHHDTKVIPQTSCFSDSFSSVLRSPNNWNKIDILCPCQCQLYFFESILISVLSGAINMAVWWWHPWWSSEL